MIGKGHHDMGGEPAGKVEPTEHDYAEWERRVDALVARAGKVVPNLRAETGERWMGFRPSLPDSLPVISPSRRVPGLIHAFGHAHHGLTQAAATGELVAALIAGERPAIDLAPYAVDRF